MMAQAGPSCVILETAQGEFSYPAIIAQGEEVYISYTFDRKNIAVVSLEAGKLWAWSEDDASMGYKLLLL